MPPSRPPRAPAPNAPPPTPTGDALLEGIFAHAGVGLCLLDPEGRVRKVNARALETVRLAAEDVIGRSLWDLFPASPPALRALHARAHAGEVVEVPEHRQVVGDREIWFAGRVSPVPFPSGTGVLITSWDVTAAKRAELAAREEHAKLRRQIAGTPLALVEWDGDYRVVGYSRRAEELFGFAPEEVLGKRIDEIPWVPEEDWPAVRAGMRDMWTADRPTNVNANRNRRKDGSVIDCEWYNSALHDGSGRLVSVLSLVLDVTAQKRAQEALRASEARARAVMDNVRDQMVVMEAVRDAAGAIVDWRYVDANDGALALVGAGRELMGTSVRKFLGEERAAARLPQLARVLETGEAERYDGSYGGRSLLVTLFRVGDDRVASASVDITDRKRAEARAEALARFPEENPDPVLRISADLTVAYANPAARARLRALGVAPGAPAPHALAELARRAHAEGARVKSEIECEGAAFSVSVVPVGDEVNVYAGDVTARKAAEQAVRLSEERFRRLVEVSSQIVWVTNASGEAVEDSPSWRAYTGRTYEQWAGWGWLDGVHPDDRGRLAAAWRHATATLTPYHIEFRQIHASGEYRHIECRAVPLFDEGGSVREWVGMNVDVTERRQAEARLREANERLVEADRRKDEFLAMLSHELRNPLAPIRNAVHILGQTTPSGEQFARAKAVIGRQVTHLARLVDDLLDVTRIARGKIELRREPLDLVAVAHRAAEDHRPILYERGVSLAIELPSGPAWVHGDATRLTQVLGNLLQNAAKFTDRGGRVTVAVLQRGGEVEVRVRDTGVGIAPDMLGRMFEPFVQADQSLARTQGGLGLGLALVKGIVDLHGGTVHAESAGRGAGAEFVVRLPAVAGPAAGEERPAAARRQGSRRVLVVDDNRDGAESLADILRVLGHEVEVALDGPSAIAKARASRPDVVLCDIGLPGMSGYEVARQLRALLSPPAKLVAISGYARPADVEQALEAGFDGHVPKPPDPAEILRLLAS